MATKITGRARELAAALAPHVLAVIASNKKRIDAGWPETEADKASREEVTQWWEDQR
jgi:hypothetical protein